MHIVLFLSVRVTVDIDENESVISCVSFLLQTVFNDTELNFQRCNQNAYYNLLNHQLS